MKKFAQIALAMLLSVGLLSGCGQSYEAETSTVFVLKDGKVVSTDVEAFDENTYDKEGLESYVQDALDSYNSANGEDAVTMKSLTVEEGSAVLILEYASAVDYARFNELEFYAGSVAEALSAGYPFDVEFCSITDGNASPCNVNDFLGSSDYKVVIVRGNTDVHVDGKVAYVSEANTTYVDASTIRIQEGTSLLGKAVADIEGTEAEPTGTEEESTQGQDQDSIQEDGSVSDDDLLLLDTEEETAEVFFPLEGEDQQMPDEEESQSQVYTYIIYK